VRAKWRKREDADFAWAEEKVRVNGVPKSTHSAAGIELNFIYLDR
jgi:hypothetical protein